MPNTHYKLDVCAFNSAGDGPKSHTTEFETKKARKYTFSNCVPC